MTDSYQVVDVLMLVGNVAPIAIYFLILGLVNTHSRPYVITRRADFVALSIALAPLILWPLPTLVRAEAWWVMAVAVALIVSASLWFLPPVRSGFVIYNVDERRLTRVLEDSLRRLGWSGQWGRQTWLRDDGAVALHIRPFSLLRNVTVDVEFIETPVPREIERLGVELQQRTSLISQLPSTTGACLVFVGAGLLILPMWMVGRHIHDLVDAMSQLFG